MEPLAVCGGLRAVLDLSCSLFQEIAYARFGFRFALRDACPLLVDSDCSAYAERPMGCRQFVSTNLDGCRSAFERGSADLPFVPAAANAGLIFRSLLLGAAASLNLKADTYELSSALAIALSEPDAERRWLAGADPLSAAMRTPQPPNMQSSVQRWSQMLAGLFE